MNTKYVKCDSCDSNGYCLPNCIGDIHVGCGGRYQEITYNEAFEYAKNYYDESFSSGYTVDQALEYIDDKYGTRIRNHIEKYNRARMNMFFT